jgi:hypothetical protein
MVILTRKMATDYLVSNRQKPLVGTVGAFDPGLFANPTYPLISADWRISKLAGFAIFKAARIDVVAPPEERSEECDLNFRWREMIHIDLLLHCARIILTEEL